MVEISFTANKWSLVEKGTCLFPLFYVFVNIKGKNIWGGIDLAIHHVSFSFLSLSEFLFHLQATKKFASIALWNKCQQETH